MTRTSGEQRATAAVTQSHVLIVSTMLDLSTDAVVRRLTDAGVQCTRWNTELFPLTEQLTTRLAGDLEVDPHVRLTRTVVGPTDFDDVTAVWYRRVRIPERDPGMDGGVYDFCVREARAALLGTLLGALPRGVRWMSPPTAVWAAEHKLFQLAVARRVGLQIPDTVVTNDATDMRAVFERFDRKIIGKPVRGGYVEVDGKPFAIYTSPIDEADLADLSGAELSPVILQPLIEKRCDIRVTAVGNRLFVAGIDSQRDPAARVDWRATEDPHLPHMRLELPDEVASASRALLRELGLAFGALDFVLTPGGDYVFLEVNPNGQWLWLDDQLGFDISGAVASWLAEPGAQSPEVAHDG